MKLYINLYNKLYKLLLPLLLIENHNINNDILDNIIIIFNKKKILIKYTNLNIFFIIKISIKGKYKKKILISYKKIINILKYIKEDITLYVKKKFIKICTKCGVYRINTLKYKYYPKFIKFKKKKEIFIYKKDILSILDYISFIKYNEKDYMNGLFIKIKKNYIIFYSTNNLILSFVKIKNQNFFFKKKYIFYIKKNFFLILKNYINKYDKNKYLKISFNNKYIKFIYLPINLLIKYKKKKYINFKKLLKNSKKNTLLINKNIFIYSIRRILSNTKSNYNIILLLKHNNVTINNNSKNNFYKEKIIGFYNGKKKKILIDAKNLINIFNIIKKENIKLYIENNCNFIFIKNTFLFKNNIKLILLLTTLKN
ncbi:MAG: hypothetical protein ABNO82_00700 [Candidatus Shikimatogenerans sp. Tder]|uniref:Beta sliding clamp n=1 Tax=Candidatus Shikimatogenerans sp. Tder TaxID=3158566 RepID=A0AAU7QTR0_9FLAO